MKKISISIIIIAFLLALSYAGFGKSTEITDYELVSGIAIDKSENLWKITCEITNVSKDKAFGNSAKYVKGEGFTVEKAFENAADKSDKLFYMDSVRIFVISEALKTDKELQNYFLKSDVNMRAVAVLCKGSAEKLFDTQKEDGVKSVFLTDRIKRFCFDIKKPVPKIISYLKESGSVYLTELGTPERSDM